MHVSVGLMPTSCSKPSTVIVHFVGHFAVLLIANFNPVFISDLRIGSFNIGIHLKIGTL